MIRIIGFFVGSFLSVSALVLLLGIPEFHRRDAGEAGRERMDTAIENVRRKWEDREAPEPSPDGALANAAPQASAPPVAQPPEPSPAALGSAVPGGDSAEPAPATVPREWHAIWAPFRTEIAARGFVSRLENVTGLDFRVAKLGKGAWQVAFAYRDETERDAGLEQIAAATGLDLSPDRP